jgi:uncharacterized RDD family membrane protein YckC
MPYYVVKDGQRVGPLSDEDFQSRILSGEIGPDTLNWQPGMADWKRYAEHTGMEAPQATVSPSPSSLNGPIGICAECGNTFVQDDLVAIAGASVCEGCKPLYLQRVREMAWLPNAFQYAGFWIRFLAKIIDRIILGVMGAAVGLGLAGLNLSMSVEPGQFNPVQLAVSMVTGLVIGIGYTVFFLGKFGATPGKMAVGIKVIRSDGAPITYGRAGIILYIGYIMAGFDEEKRALHDHICDTRVVKN